jgi:DNA-binding response OmpR family regulator
VLRHRCFAADWVRDGRAAEADDYLVKLFELDELLAGCASPRRAHGHGAERVALPSPDVEIERNSRPQHIFHNPLIQGIPC